MHGRGFIEGALFRDDVAVKQNKVFVENFV